MSYRIYRFGYVAMPTARLSGAFGSGPSVDHASRVIGEAFDGYAWHQQNTKVPYELTYSAWLHHWNVDVVKLQLEGWHFKRGKRDLLYRMDETDIESEHWAYARLMQVRTPYQYQRKTMQPIDLVFQMLTGWYQDAQNLVPWYLDDGYYLDAGLYLDQNTPLEWTLDASPKAVTVNNIGNATTRYVAFTITAGSDPITAVTINTYQTAGAAECNVTWTGTLIQGHELVIDGRNRTVTNNGADAYAGFALGTTHANDYWFELPPGESTVTVTLTGGSTDSTLTAEYAHGWS